MFKWIRSKTLSSGLAMFSMFFGAGNIIFPLALGHDSQDKTFFAIGGLLITAVFLPFAGLIAIILCDGDYHRFFKKIGKVPGFILAAIIISLLGPLGSTPRCIALAYSTIKMSFPTLSSTAFSVGVCLLIYVITIQQKKMVDILGKILTPILLCSLAFIIIAGILTPGHSEAIDASRFSSFVLGLKEGYNTMDLLAAFFFSSMVIAHLKSDQQQLNRHQLLYTALKSSLLGAGLLAITYIGFSYVASLHSHTLQIEGIDQLLAAMTLKIMGPYAGLFACLTIALACLTTAIGLSSAFAQFLQTSICRGKIRYKTALALTLISTFFVSRLEFNGISAILGPVLEFCYPALIVLTFVNIIEGMSKYRIQPNNLEV